MKTGIAAAVLVAIALSIFNPGMDDFRRFIADRAQELILHEAGDSALGRALSGAGGSLAGRYVDRITHRENFILFSTYTVDLDGPESDEEHWTFLGLVGQFMELERPPSLDSTREAPTRSEQQPNE